MPSTPPRCVSVIDADLHSCRVVLGGAERELEEVRRRRRELAALEATLVVSIDVPRARADRLLDERLHVSGA